MICVKMFMKFQIVNLINLNNETKKNKKFKEFIKIKNEPILIITLPIALILTFFYLLLDHCV